MGTRQGVMVGIVAAGLGVLVAQPLAGTAAVLPQPAAGSAVPQLTVPMPSVSVPSVTTPAVSTPVATVPSGSTPVATVPSVSTPSPTIPSPTIPSPTIPAPTTPSPTIPAVSAPVATVPVRTTASKVSALVGGPTRSAQPSGAPGDPASAAPDSTAATGLAGGATTLSAGGAASGSGAAAAPGMARDPHAALARGRAGAAGRGSPRARRAAAARESRRLRRLVAGLHGCIGTLGAGARRLLTLRAGLHGPARSAVATAHILHVSAGREARLERMALIALQRSAGTGCAAPGNGVAPALASAGMLSLSAPQLGGSPSTSTSASASSGPSASLSAAHARRAPRGGRPVDALRAAATVEERADTGSSFPSVLVPALLALVLALALLALPETRRRLRPAAAHSRAGAGPGGQRSAHTLPPAAPIAYSAIAAPHRSDPPRSAAPRTGMDDTLDQMAANIVAQMKRDSPIADTHAEAEAYGLDSQVEVERELLPQGPKVRPSDPLRSHPAPWRPGAWARKHVAQAALVATVLMSGLTRVRRRARRRRRS